MPMTKQEAIEILKLVEDVYDMGFNTNKQKAMTWIELLMQKGDYNPSLRKTKVYIQNNKFKPTVAELIDYKPKGVVIKEKPIEETHQYKLEHDQEYAKKWQDLQRKGRAFIEELRNND